jgi:Mechanosensitive ion channel, beta-domain
MELNDFLNWQMAVYLLLIFGSQLLLWSILRYQRQKVALRRSEAGLPPDLLIDSAETLSRQRWEAGVQAGLLLFTIFAIPLFFFGFKGLSGSKGILTMFIVIFIWLLMTGTDVARAFLGGLAFKTLVAFQRAIQVGDRVTLKGHSGKVIGIGIFFVTLQTPDDDLIDIPTRDLWSDVLVSANAGERASLCVMKFYLAPFVSKAQRQRAEDMIWESMQASPFCDPAKPMQIYLSQEPNAIELTAKAYVTSTYDEPMFKSDVSRAFFDLASAESIFLAGDQWRMRPNNL